MFSKLATTLALAGLGLSLTVAGAQAANLVTNGGFETLTSGPGQLGFNTNATGWTGSGYTFVFASGTADTTGSNGQDGNVQLWGPSNGSSNGLPASSPAGGNFVGADGAFEVEPLSQTISGLTVGGKYVVSFWWAGAQQAGFTSPTTEQWDVSLGSDSQATLVVSNVSEGFTGWQQAALTFTASAASELLSFTAVGTPSGVPPFVLLDGVSMNAVPEPASLALLGVGMAGLGAIVRRQRAWRLGASQGVRTR